jgi:branched-chain amino acid transport system permease protein
MVVGTLALLLNLVRSGIGRRLAAVAQDETAATSFGIDVGSLKLKTFVLSAVLASLAGSLFAHYHGYVHPDSFSVFASLDMVIMVVIGGLGSLWGSIVGAAFVTCLPHLLGRFEMAKEVIHGVVLVVIMVVLPRGLVSGLVDLLGTAVARRRMRVTVPT